MISSRVFMTKGPAHATGSRSGKPDGRAFAEERELALFDAPTGDFCGAREYVNVALVRGVDRLRYVGARLKREVHVLDRSSRLDDRALAERLTGNDARSSEPV